MRAKKKENRNEKKEKKHSTQEPPIIIQEVDGMHVEHEAKDRPVV